MVIRGRHRLRYYIKILEFLSKKQNGKWCRERVQILEHIYRHGPQPKRALSKLYLQEHTRYQRSRLYSNMEQLGLVTYDSYQCVGATVQYQKIREFVIKVNEHDTLNTDINTYNQ